MKSNVSLSWFLFVGLAFTFSFAEIPSRTATKKSGRIIDLSPSKKQIKPVVRAKHSDDGYEKIDISQFKEFETATKKSAMKSICTTKSGAVYRDNQTGYDNCLRQVQLERSSQNRSSDPNSTSVGVEFGGEN